ncbi:hypothetical protein GCM10007276_17510 [Agaricicola taiwanensis]|uniref:DUF6468 domain-containing protein n=1 Tax=Agaricicola taiwanensis TaxID=591372 RepID=A0A8J2VSL3_9RHOB|nr:DUF6468 domain-containing protein [Agaricicola taiwanensis]GGE40657.1 hypothetical protein GCM10007276_17510 [Agaricicola taiwanensis]
MNNGFALMIEGTVAILLVTTIGYCFVLNRKLVRLRTDETALRATIAELVTATDIAERAIAGFKVAIRDCDVTLAERLRVAERVSVDMADQIASGQDVLKRIAMITEAARPASVAEAFVAEDCADDAAPAVEARPAPQQSKAAAAALAAQALAMRARERRAASAAA